MCTHTVDKNPKTMRDMYTHLFLIRLIPHDIYFRVCSPTQSGRTKSSDEMPPKPKGPKRGFLAFYSEIRADLQKENPGEWIRSFPRYRELIFGLGCPVKYSLYKTYLSDSNKSYYK